jgi:hypothetical protein
MLNCGSLRSPDFSGLSNLTTVGSFWMDDCPSLVSPNFSGLSRLTRVGAYCMAHSNDLNDATRIIVRYFRESYGVRDGGDRRRRRSKVKSKMMMKSNKRKMVCSRKYRKNLVQ